MTPLQTFRLRWRIANALTWAMVGLFAMWILRSYFLKEYTAFWKFRLLGIPSFVWLLLMYWARGLLRLRYFTLKSVLPILIAPFVIYLLYMSYMTVVGYLGSGKFYFLFF